MSDPLVAQLDGQLEVSGCVGSRFYAVLLERMRGDAEAEPAGPVRTALAGHERDRVDEWDAFRLLAGVHKLVLTLLACIFPDESERFELLERAIAVARETPAAVEGADLAAWVSDRLAGPRPGLGTVVYHTIVWPYLPDSVRETVEAELAAAGQRATPEAPLALLSFEGAEDHPSRVEVHLTEWPGGERRLLARSGQHPVTVEWLA